MEKSSNVINLSDGERWSCECTECHGKSFEVMVASPIFGDLVALECTNCGWSIDLLDYENDSENDSEDDSD